LNIFLEYPVPVTDSAVYLCCLRKLKYK
jgi:hypothetical protein